jgi:hypothetical protein
MPGIVFMNDCCVDGCYKKIMKSSIFCKIHESEYQKGAELSVYYGKKIKKGAADSPSAKQVFNGSLSQVSKLKKALT